MEEDEIDHPVEAGVEINPATDPEVSGAPRIKPEWEQAMRNQKVREARAPTEAEQRRRIRELCRRMESNNGEPESDEARDLIEELRGLTGEIPDAEKFVAGGFARHYAAWDELMQLSGRKGRNVLSWVKRGYRPVFADASQAKPEKLKIVREMLRRQYPGRDPEAFLTGDRPHKVSFKNHQSLYKHWDFSAKTLLQLVQWGAVEILDDESQIQVISPLGVADQDGKLRLILNARYLNVFLKNLEFKYQRLRDALLFLEKDSHMATWNLKSGYYHIFLHPSARKYIGFKVGNLLLRYTVPAFGFSQA